MICRRSCVVSGASMSNPRVRGCASQLESMGRPPCRGAPRARILIRAANSSDELDPAGGEQHHLEQQPAVLPALDVRGPVGPLAVTDREIDDLEALLGRPEDEVEVAEG